MKPVFRIPVILILLVLLILIRFFESQLFYDPLLEFYSSDYLRAKLPAFEATPLLLNVLFRFALNSAISLAIIYVAFLDRSILKFSFYLYLILFAIAFPLYMFFIFTIENQNYLALFYVRRFLIQPVFVIIILPAFYYYRLQLRQHNKFKRFPGKN